MPRRTIHVVWGMSMAAVFGSSIGCHLVFPHQPGVSSPEPCRLCSARIYRTLPDGTNQISEEWESYVWPSGGDPYTQCVYDLQHYINHGMAPGFVWNQANLTITPILKPAAANCDEPAGLPLLFGAALGAELRWNYPPASQASVSIWLVDQNGVTRTAEPAVANAYASFTERMGVPDWPYGSLYMIGRRHVRFSDLSLELQTPFALGSDITITKCYVQSVGTVIGYKDDKGTQYQFREGTAKFFFYGTGTKDGDSGTTSFCFTNQGTQGVTIYQGLAYPFFALSLDLTSSEIGQNMRIQISLSKLASWPSGFETHQPYVYLTDKQTANATVDLVPDVAVDHDNDLQKFLWFEDYELKSEKFLGTGNPCQVTFAPGLHAVTLVAYDAKGAYGSDTMMFRYTPPIPPNDLCGSATPIMDGQYFGTLVAATADGNAFCGGGPQGQPNTEPDVWYRYTPPANGTLHVSTCGTNDTGGTDAGMDTVLSVHSACTGTTANELACNDDWINGSDSSACTQIDTGASRDSAVALSVTWGQEVLIRVSRYSGSPAAPFTLNVLLEASSPPNNMCRAATPISDGWYYGTLAGASNDGNASCGGSTTGEFNAEVDVWYFYTAAQEGLLKVSTCGSHDFGGIDAGMDTVLSAHSECQGMWSNELACNDDWPSSPDSNACNVPWPFYDAPTRRDSALSVPMSAGQSLMIRVSKYSASSPGFFYLTIGLAPRVPVDFDFDGDVDRTDVDYFDRCASGPGIPCADGCHPYDLDTDGDVDQRDFAAVQRCYSGENVPTDPNCMN